jgi:hypothetical protein
LSGVAEERETQMDFVLAIVGFIAVCAFIAWCMGGGGNPLA